MSSGSPDGAAALASAANEDEGAQPSSSTPTSPNINKEPENLPSAVEFEPPLACVRRILKHTLPSSTNVGKDASAAFARATGIFIIYLTSCANDFARENKRQTITANDVLAATKELDFEEFIPDMTSFLENYRAMEKSKKDAKAKDKASKPKDDEEATADKTGKPNDDGADEEVDDDDDNESHDGTAEHDVSHKRGHDEVVGAEAAESLTKKAKTDSVAANEPADSDRQPEGAETEPADTTAAEE